MLTIVLDSSIYYLQSEMIDVRFERQMPRLTSHRNCVFRFEGVVGRMPISAQSLDCMWSTSALDLLYMRYWYSCSTECKHVFGGGISKMKSLASGKLIRLHPMIDKKCHLTITKKNQENCREISVWIFVLWRSRFKPQAMLNRTHSQHGQSFS